MTMCNGGDGVEHMVLQVKIEVTMQKYLQREEWAYAWCLTLRPANAGALT